MFKYCKVHLITSTIPQVNTAWICTDQNKTDTQKAPTALELKTVKLQLLDQLNLTEQNGRHPHN